MADTPIMPQQHPFVKTLAGALKRRCGLSGGARLLLAVSGGADSVALLRALAALRPARTWRLDLAVGHVQHHLRPEAAEEDARFVADLARHWHLPFLRMDLEADQWRQPGNIEARARRLRYRALVEMAQAAQYGFIATAHQADDQLETLLMRLVRGTSVGGLGGMPWRRNLRPPAGGPPILLIRPMLAVTRAQVRAFLEQYHQPWREDHTNSDLTRWRARLRAQVLPVLEQIKPGAALRAVALTDHLRQVRRVLAGAVDQAADRVKVASGRYTLDRADLGRLPAVVLLGLLRRELHHAGVPADRLGRRHLGPLARAITDQAGGRRVFGFARGVRATVQREVVVIGR